MTFQRLLTRNHDASFSDIIQHKLQCSTCNARDTIVMTKRDERKGRPGKDPDNQNGSSAGLCKIKSIAWRRRFLRQPGITVASWPSFFRESERLRDHPSNRIGFNSKRSARWKSKMSWYRRRPAAAK